VRYGISLVVFASLTYMAALVARLVLTVYRLPF